MLHVYQERPARHVVTSNSPGCQSCATGNSTVSLLHNPSARPTQAVVFLFRPQLRQPGRQVAREVYVLIRKLNRFRGQRGEVSQSSAAPAFHTLFIQAAPLKGLNLLRNV